MKAPLGVLTRICPCGASLSVDSTPAKAADDIAAMFDELHREHAVIVHRAHDDWHWDGDWDHHPGPITLTCCGRKPFEVGTGDHMTWDDARVTCTGGAS